MSVEGVPSVDDVLKAIGRERKGRWDDDVYVAEAVHALYAPVLDKLAGELRDARWALAGAGVEAARYREALAFYATPEIYEETVREDRDLDGRMMRYYGDPPIWDDGGEIARAALVEPKGQD